MSHVRNLNLHFSDFQIEIPEMTIGDQGVTALLGPSGSGKTTVVRALLGLQPCPTLEWIWQGEDLAKLKPGDRRIGVVFQNYDLFTHMTGEENIAFAADARKISVPVWKSKLQDLAEMLSVQNILKRPVTVLSGGERQRVALIRALIGQPRILFLDEPFTALDKNLRSQARTLVKSIIASEKIPTLLISHDDEDVQVLSDQFVRMKDGRIVD